MKKYILDEIKVLKDFGISLSAEERQQLESQTNEIAAHNYAISLREKRAENWNNWYKDDTTSTY